MPRSMSVTGDPELDTRLHRLLGEFAYVEFRHGGSFTIYTGSGVLDERGNLLPGLRRSARPGIYEFDVPLDPDRWYVVVSMRIETADLSFGSIECGYGKTIAGAIADAEKRFQTLPDHAALRVLVERGIHH